MKPVGLVTCYFHHNYGSMLQAYATEMIMQKMGLPYLTISCKRPRDYMVENKYLYYLKKILIGDWKMFLGKERLKKAIREYPDFGEKWSMREAAFDEFAKCYFHTSKFCRNRTELEAMANDFYAFLVGSDKLWRTDSVEHGYYTLEWVPDNIRKIAYSTSIGVKKIPWFQVGKNKKFMNRFNFIAMREQSACDIVKSLTGRDVPVVLDPTLLFTGDDWLGIQQQEALVKGKYIFVYLLGNNPDQREYIKQVKAQTGYKIVALQHLDDYIPGDEGFADIAPYVGPKEFLNYIRNAELVFTDSFHCSVFSILYHKNFHTFSRFGDNARQNTNTRIDNLLHITGLEDRRWNVTNSIEASMKAPNYAGVEDKLDAMRESSWNYLNKALANLKDND